MEEKTSEKSEVNNPMVKKFVLGLIAIAILGGVGYWAVSSGRIDLGNLKLGGESQAFVATVNGEGIEKRLFDMRFSQATTDYEARGTVLGEVELEELKKKVLDDMIEELLLVQYGKENGIEASENDVESRYQEISGGFDSEEKFKAELLSQGLTMADFRMAVYYDIIMEGVIEREIEDADFEILEEEMRRLYDEALANGVEVPEYDAVKGDIEQFIRQQRTNEIIATLVDRLRTEATIEL